jgi:hypothetical protein
MKYWNYAKNVHENGLHIKGAMGI